MKLFKAAILKIYLKHYIMCKNRKKQSEETGAIKMRRLKEKQHQKFQQHFLETGSNISPLKK